MDLDVERKEKKGGKYGGWKDGLAIIWDGKVYGWDRSGGEDQKSNFGQKFEM